MCGLLFTQHPTCRRIFEPIRATCEIRLPPPSCRLVMQVPCTSLVPMEQRVCCRRSTQHLSRTVGASCPSPPGSLHHPDLRTIVRCAYRFNISNSCSRPTH